jgi:hypothetical protein
VNEQKLRLWDTMKSLHFAVLLGFSVLGGVQWRLKNYR